VPYIEQIKRDDIEASLRELIEDLEAHGMQDGMLNYVFTRILLAYSAFHGENYLTLQSTIGILECAKLEIYRRKIAPYEDSKRGLNGDVYVR